MGHANSSERRKDRQRFAVTLFVLVAALYVIVSGSGDNQHFLLASNAITAITAFWFGAKKSNEH